MAAVSHAARIVRDAGGFKCDSDASVMIGQVQVLRVEDPHAAKAALLENRDRFRDRQVGLILSGGNIDLLALSSIIQRGLARSGRLVRLRVGIPDVPGSLAEASRVIGEANANIIEVRHQRAFTNLSLRVAEVEFVLQALGHAVLPLVAALARMVLLVILVFGFIGPRDLGPALVFGAATVSTYLEAVLDRWLLARKLDAIEREQSGGIAGEFARGGAAARRGGSGRGSRSSPASTHPKAGVWATTWRCCEKRSSSSASQPG